VDLKREILQRAYEEDDGGRRVGIPTTLESFKGQVDTPVRTLYY
jgi:hypothetical protein